MANLIGDRVGQQLGNYQLIRLLGQGGFAEVYLGEHVYLKTSAAIKVLRTQLSQGDQESFLAEARTIARLKHKHILQVLEFGVEDSTPFLVMAYVPNGTLRQRHLKGSRLTPVIILTYVKQVADALQYAHGEKLIHRDIKPENMLLGPNNEVLLSDFGIALGTQSSRSQNMQDVAGMATYMAPELLQGKLRPASDQYALGIVIYEWLSGDTPFHGSFMEIASQQVLAPPPALKRPTVSVEVEKVIMTALEKDPGRRFASVRAFANAFEQASLLEEETVRAQPGWPLAPSAPPGLQIDDLITVPMVDSTAEALPSTVLPAPPDARLHSATTLPVAPTSQSALPTTLQAPFAQHEPQHRRSLPIGRIISLIALVLLVIAGSFGLAYYTAVLHPAQLRAQATASTQAALTMQVMATAQARQEIYTKATSGTPVLNDPLNQDNNQWTVRQAEAPQPGSCAFTGGAFHVIASQPEDFVSCRNLGTSFDNFAYQVQMTVLKGDEGGIDFRLSNTTGYIFSINQDGLYTFETFQNINIVLLHRSSSAIKTDLNQTNLLTVVARGKSFFLYVNKQYVADVSDDASIIGVVGVCAFAGQNPTEVAFSNVQIWKL